MALFFKRPLALGCFLFFAVSLLAGYFPVTWTLGGMAFFGISSILLFALPKTRKKLFGAALCLLVVFLSLCHSFATTELPEKRAERWIGKRMVLCEVIEDGHGSLYSTDAVVRLVDIDGERVHIKGQLRYDFATDLRVGDQIYAYATVDPYEAYSTSVLTSRKESDGILLSVSVANAEDGQIRRLSDQPLSPSMLTNRNGLRILIHRMRTGLHSYLAEHLGSEIGGLSHGFFVGDTSGVSDETMLSFRRAGVTHLLSVSGLHLTILLGAIELFLRGLTLPKKCRILIVSFLSILLLILTGFAASACRAVLMLLSVYYQFMLSENCDGITSLFTSIAAIVLISPYSVNDLGLWMSFLATLGLLTVYPVWESVLYRIKAEKGWKGILNRCARGILGGFLLTSAANLLLLPITWWFFGEFSWVGLFCNVVISPVSSLFLVSIPLYLLLGWIPFLGSGLQWIVMMLGMAVRETADLFARIPYGVVSLRYEFCAVIVGAVSAITMVFLLIRLRKKWLLALPPLVAVVAFLLCFSVNSLWFSKTEAVYLRSDAYTEAIYWKDHQRLALCDLSSGGWRGTEAVLQAYQDSYATEVDTLILTHWHKGHPSMLEQLSERLLLRRVMLPMPLDQDEAELAWQCVSLARTRHISVEFYDSAEPIVLWDGLIFYAEKKVGEKHDEIALLSVGERKSLLYLSPDLLREEKTEAVGARMEQHHTVIFGNHGTHEWKECSYPIGDSAKTEQIVYASGKCASFCRVEGFDGTALIPSEERESISFSLVLS